MAVVSPDFKYLKTNQKERLVISMGYSDDCCKAIHLETNEVVYWHEITPKPGVDFQDATKVAIDKIMKTDAGFRMKFETEVENRCGCKDVTYVIITTSPYFFGL